MAVSVDFSYKFASLVRQLHESPDDPVLKQALVSKIPEMMVLAKENPLALYRLAQIHSPSSPQYQQMMRQSANMGCTNAMLAICEVILKADASTSADLQTVVHYVKMIERSRDSFILDQCKTLMASNPEITALMSIEPKAKTDSYNSGIRFFARLSDAQNDVQVEVENQFSI